MKTPVITTDGMMQLIASISKEPRPPSSHGSLFAQNIIWEELLATSYNVIEQKCPLKDWRQVQPPSIEIISPDNKLLNAMPAILSASTPPDGIFGTAAKAEPILMLESFSWERLALLDSKCDPVAYIISSPKEVRIQPIPENAQNVPYVIVNYESFLELDGRIASGKTVKLRVNNQTLIAGQCLLHNIITQPRYDSNILVCAHYDSTFNSPGALDNASGVAITLGLAKAAMENNWPCQFVFFDGEELNKAGSRAYVDSLSQQELNGISHVIEIDTVGSGNDILLLCSKKLSKILKSVPFYGVLSKEYLVQVSPQTRIAFCDVWPFMQKGKRVVRMLARAAQNSNRGHYYIHKEQDTIDKVEPTTVLSCFLAAIKIVEYLCKKETK